MPKSPSRLICPDCKGRKDYYFDTCGSCSSISWPERFMRWVELGDKCWIWKGATLRTGYGAFGIGPRKSHRVSYELFNGPIPPGKMVCHSCDNPPCVNPEHLWIGTNRENILDSIKKGRKPAMKGELNGMAKIKKMDAENIRNMGGKFTQSILAHKFGISRTQVSRILGGKRWKTN
jgi:hypothetical protein